MRIEPRARTGERRTRTRTRTHVERAWRAPVAAVRSRVGARQAVPGPRAQRQATPASPVQCVTQLRHSFHVLLHRGLELVEGELPVAVGVGGRHHQLDGPVVGIVPMLPQCRLQLGSIDAAALVLVDLGEERLQAFVVELASECVAGLRGADGSITGASINTEERARSVFGDGDSLPATTGRRQQHHACSASGHHLARKGAHRLDKRHNA